MLDILHFRSLQNIQFCGCTIIFNINLLFKNLIVNYNVNCKQQCEQHLKKIITFVQNDLFPKETFLEVKFLARSVGTF